MEVPALVPYRFGHLADEGDDVMVGGLLDLGDPVDIDSGAGLDGPNRLSWNHASGNLGAGDSDLDPEHLLEPSLVRPDGAHLGQGVPGNHEPAPSSGLVGEAAFWGELADDPPAAFVGAFGAV